jgi:hypothetical protein
MMPPKIYPTKKLRGFGDAVAANPMPDSGPGGLLHNLIVACGFRPTKHCGCARFARQMNEWGWTGCLTTHRQEIVDWLCAKAHAAGVPLAADTVTGLVLAALKSAVNFSLTEVQTP